MFKLFYKKMTHFTKHDIFGNEFLIKKWFNENR